MRPASMTPSQLNLPQSGSHIEHLQIKKQTYLLKILQEGEVNKNLKELYHNLKLKIRTANRNSQEIENQKSSVKAQISRQKPQLNDQENLNKKSKKLQIEVQHMTHLLNILVSSNNKLKDQVNNYRNSRVIYSNVYKNLEKQIRKYEDQYKKMEIIENLSLEGAFLKIKDKIIKIKAKCEKEVEHYKNEQSRICENAQVKSQAQKQNTANLMQSTNISLKNVDQLISNIANIDEKQENGKQKERLKKSAIKTFMKKTKSKLDNTQSTRMFQAQEKKIYLESILSNLKSMTGSDSLSEIIDYYFSLGKANQNVYQQYRKLEEENKIQQEKLQNLQRQIAILKDKSECDEVTATPTTNFIDQQYQLQQLAQSLQKEQLQLQEIQKKISLKIDMNCKNMSEQDIQYHLKMKKDKKPDTNATRNLEKILEKTQKKKNEESYIMSAKQMHKSNLKLLQ